MSQADCILCMILNFKTTLLKLKLLASYDYSYNMRRCQTFLLRKLKYVSKWYEEFSLSYKLSFQTHQFLYQYWILHWYVVFVQTPIFEFI